MLSKALPQQGGTANEKSMQLKWDAASERHFRGGIWRLETESDRLKQHNLDLGIFRVQHGGNHPIEHLILPDAAPVLPNDHLVAQSHGNLTGIRYGRFAEQAEKIGGQIKDVAGHKGDGSSTVDAATFGLVDRFGHRVQTGSAEQLDQGRFEKGDFTHAHYIDVDDGIKHQPGDLLALGETFVIPWSRK